jgi:putative dehydrogenase
MKKKNTPENVSPRPRVGVIGLGIMGTVMAGELIKAGYAVTGYDIEPSARVRLKKLGGRPLGSALEVAAGAEVLIVSLATSAALRDTVEKIGAAKRAVDARRPIVIETSTLPIDDKLRALQALKRGGITVLDCPISGTAERMKERAWTVFCSGSKSACEAVKPVLQVFTDNVPYVGVFGNGSKMKFAANHLVAIYNVAYAESVTLARKLGLDPQDVLDLFGDSRVIGTGVMRLRVPFMISRRYVPATMKVQVWQKDMQVIGDAAKSVDCPTPLFTACVPIYSAAMAQGHSQDDTASVSEVLAGMAGIAAAAPQARRRRKPSSP